MTICLHPLNRLSSQELSLTGDAFINLFLNGIPYHNYFITVKYPEKNKNKIIIKTIHKIQQLLETMTVAYNN